MTFAYGDVEVSAMRRSVPILLASFCVTAMAAAEVPQTFDKHYPMQGRAELQAEIGNGSIKARSCGSCRDIHVHLEMNDADRSRFHIEESQSGNHVRFVLKQEESHDWHWNSGRGPELMVEVPQEAALDLHSGNGSLSLAGVRGDISMNTGNGSISVNDAGGQLKLHSGNGSVSGNDLSGNLSASTGNGSMHMTGRFSRLEAHTGNGTLDLEAGGPDALHDGAAITSGSGSVTLRLDRSAHATVHLSSGSGGIHSNLPITTQGDIGDRHDLTGTLNGGGATVRVDTGSGSVRLESL